MQQEQRSTTRYSLPLEINYAGASGIYQAYTADISASGCYIKSAVSTQLGESVLVRMRVPRKGSWIVKSGLVVRYQPHHGFGIKFSSTLETQSLLEEAPFELTDSPHHLSNNFPTTFSLSEEPLRRPAIEKANTRERRTCGLIGQSIQMEKLRDEISRASRSHHAVLLSGESGTGKTTTARLIHISSKRAERAFVEVNCAAIPETLLEAELFGYEKGAFTGAVNSKKGRFEEADGGTLFLDEIGEMSQSMQAKLLKAIEEKTIRRLGGTRDVRCDVRIIAATSRNLQAMVAEKSFREDLYYRLAVLEVYSVPLRERASDIPLLIQHRLKEEQSLAATESPFGIEERAIELLMSYHWPGNIRQLQNVIARLTTRAGADNFIRAEDVSHCLKDLPSVPGLSSKDQCSIKLFNENSYEDRTEGEILLPQEVRIVKPGETLNEFIARVIVSTIEVARENNGGNILRTAQRLGTDRASLMQRLERAKAKLVP